MSFSNYLIDDRILKAIKKLNWKKPTKVQEESLENSLNNKDLLIQSKTGSGKTAIYTITILESILREYNNIKNKKYSNSIIIVPSKELCNQVNSTIMSLSIYCKRFINLINLGNDQFYNEYINNINNEFKIIIGTPSRIIKYIINNKLISNLKHIIFDEADLLFSYGYKNEIEELINLLSNKNNNKSQIIIVSATLNNCVNEISKLILDNPISIKPNEPLLPNEIQLLQYIIKYHIVEYFNSGKLDILIALDQSTILNKINNDKEYSSSRGLDFYKVDNIINFNFPLSITSYIHRVGRTARANNKGLALSLVSPDELNQLQQVETFLKNNVEITLRPFSFKIDIVEGFRYRVDDALFSIKKTRILAARRAEIRKEILNSKKLDEYFKKNPNDKMAIKHDFNIQAKSTLTSMKFVPEYLIPDALKSNIAMIPSAKLQKSKSVGKSTKKSVRFKRFVTKDPLKSFKSLKR